MTTSRPRQLTVRATEAPKLFGGPPRSVRLLIHPSLELLRAAAVAWSSQTADFTEAHGVCHPLGLREEWNARRRKWVWENDGNPIAIVRLAVGQIYSEILVHELTHAAMVIYRRDIKRDVRLGSGGRGRLEHEEYLCYLVGELAGKAATALHKKGLWT